MTWIEKSLDELGSVSRGRSRHRPRDAQHLYGGPYPFVQTGDVKHAGLYLTRYEQTYSEAGLAQSKLWGSGTLCITIAANIADTSILGIDACFPDSVIGFVSDEQKSDARFVKYMFDARLKDRYRTFSQGVAQDNLSQEKLLSIKFHVPDDVSDQKKIADILAAYDNLIANNSRRIELLNQSAHLLFKEWFVRLRYPGHEHDKIVAGVPKGWSRTLLGKIAVCNESSYSAGSLPQSINYIDISSVADGAIVQKTRMTSEEAPGRARRRAADGDVIWSNVRPNLKQYALVLAPDDEDVFSTGFTILSAHEVPFSFLYIAVTTDAFVAHLVSHTTGASYPAVRPDDFERAKMLIPSASLLKEFHDQCEPMLRLAHSLDSQNKKLAQARDLLLPRLMDGTLPI